MDQRREPRFSADQPVRVTVLGEHPSQYSGRIRNASHRGLALEVAAAVEPGTPIKMELEDTIVLGEVVYCNSDPHGCLLGVQLDQMLCGLTALRERLQELAFEEPSGRQMANTVDHRPRQNGQQTQQQ